MGVFGSLGHVFRVKFITDIDKTSLDKNFVCVKRRRLCGSLEYCGIAASIYATFAVLPCYMLAEIIVSYDRRTSAQTAIKFCTIN